MSGWGKATSQKMLLDSQREKYFLEAVLTTADMYQILNDQIERVWLYSFPYRYSSQKSKLYKHKYEL